MNNEIIEKIQKILARADESRNDNPHEREIALRHAHALLARHGLEMSDVLESAGDTEEFGALGRAAYDCDSAMWKAIVWDQIAKLNGCRCVRSSHERKVWIIGRKVRVYVIASMARYVIESIMREARKQGHAIGQFGRGASHGVANQVRAIIADMERGKLAEEMLSHSTALAVIDGHKRALAESSDALKEFFPRTVNTSSRGGRYSSGYAAGQAYGQKVGLNTQVGRAPNARMITS